MKINKFLFGFGFIAAMAMSSCQSEDPAPNEGQDNGDVSYLAVNIVSTPEAGGRADVDADENYEAGTEAENLVKKVRFYFFKANGDAATVVNGTKNYFDWTPSSGDGEMPNVEKVLTATIVLTNAKEPEDNISSESYPAQMLAILNPDYANLPAGNPTLSTLRGICYNFAGSVANEGGFVMSNSVFLKGASRVATSTIASANVATDPSAALANPVNVYVERTMAKVRLSYDETNVSPDVNGRIALMDGATPTPSQITVDGKKVYLSITGWDVTATTKAAYLSKHVQEAWASEPATSAFGSWTWNYAPFFRCFWAQNPGKEVAGQEYFTFNAIPNNTIGGTKNVLYTNENAGSQWNGADDPTYTERTYPTQVIIAGKLVDENGDAIEVVDYAGSKFIGEENLKTAMVNFVNLYKKNMDGSNEVYTKIDIDDVKLVTALANGSAEQGQDTKGRYYVELAPSATTTPTNWCTSNLPGTQPLTDAEDIKEALRAVGHAKIWKSGMTYYFFKIRHLGEEGKAGENGVVRNHIYDCTITNIAGLGTPVYDPEETIWPEKPQPETDAYIAAKINILSWRVVKSNVDLDWNN